MKQQKTLHLLLDRRDHGNAVDDNAAAYGFNGKYARLIAVDIDLPLAFGEREELDRGVGVIDDENVILFAAFERLDGVGNHILGRTVEERHAFGDIFRVVSARRLMRLEESDESLIVV